MSKNTKLLLIFSLFVNFLLAGIVVGEFSHGPQHPFFSQNDENIPPELREKLDRRMDEAFKKTQSLRDKIDQTRKEAVNILQQDSFDEKAFELKVDDLFVLMGRMGRTMTDSVKDIARDAPPEDRASIARMLMRGPPRPGECKHFEQKEDHQEDSKESTPTQP